jgi:hypothetical protein
MTFIDLKSFKQIKKINIHELITHGLNTHKKFESNSTKPKFVTQNHLENVYISSCAVNPYNPVQTSKVYLLIRRVNTNSLDLMQMNIKLNKKFHQNEPSAINRIELEINKPISILKFPFMRIEELGFRIPDYFMLADYVYDKINIGIVDVKIGELANTINRSIFLRIISLDAKTRKVVSRQFFKDHPYPSMRYDRSCFHARCYQL